MAKIYFTLNQLFQIMSKLPQKPGMTGGKAPTGATKAPTSTANTAKGPDPKHLPREFKYISYQNRDQFLKKLQACSNSLDFND